MSDFGLDLDTPVAWVHAVARQPLALLSDHAHLELRAAASAQATIVRNPGRTELIEALAEVALEELEHFRRVHGLLVRRGGALDHKQANPYADGLLAEVRRAPRDALLDRLVVAALIERRSLERFHLLAEHLADAELAALYRDLLRSEASHQALFLRLARTHRGADATERRTAELRAVEARVLGSLPFAPRIHSGPPPG